MRAIVTVDELRGTPREPTRVGRVKAEDIAFIQYTSGITGNPKGVVLTHANLLANIRAMGARRRRARADVVRELAAALPRHGADRRVARPSTSAVPLVLMSPLDFLARPARWLWAIHRHRGTHLAGAELRLRAAACGG